MQNNVTQMYDNERYFWNVVVPYLPIQEVEKQDRWQLSVDLGAREEYFGC